jgi:hypothetical protein
LLLDNELVLKKVDDRYAFMVADQTKLKVEAFYEHFLKPYQDVVNKMCLERGELETTYSVSDYVDLSLRLMDKEEELAGKYFAHSKKVIQTTCYMRLISERATNLIYNEGSGLRVMLNQRQTDNLRQLYKFLAREKESVKSLAGALNTYINGQSTLIPNLNTISEPIGR